jgi:hypothetical protein
LKLENILVEYPLVIDFSDYWIKIADFGEAASTISDDG